AVMIIIGVMGFEFLAPVVSNEIQQINTGIQNQASGQTIRQLQEKLGDKIPLLANLMVQEELNKQIDALLKKSFSMVVNVLSAVVGLVMMVFITFFFLKDGRRMKKTVVSWVPNRYFEMALIILHKISTQLGRYIRGQLLVAAIVGTLSIMALYLLDIRYYFFIGAMAGLANMIPYFGPLVGAIPAVIIALIDTGSFGAVAAVAVAFASIQLFENIFVSPFIVSKSVELHPLTIIIAILIGGQLMGIFGMLLAVPAASIIKVTAQELIWGFKNYRIF
ncbi:MAG: AI-2E family transporter, partial [bacterium]